MDDGISRQDGLEAVGEEEKGAAGQAKKLTAEVDGDSFTKWLSHDLQAQTVCCVLGWLTARPENPSFVLWSGADMPESPPCYETRARQRGMGGREKGFVSRMKPLSLRVFCF